MNYECSRRKMSSHCLPKFQNWIKYILLGIDASFRCIIEVNTRQCKIKIKLSVVYLHTILERPSVLLKSLWLYKENVWHVILEKNSSSLNIKIKLDDICNDSAAIKCILSKHLMLSR